MNAAPKPVKSSDELFEIALAQRAAERADTKFYITLLEGALENSTKWLEAMAKEYPKAAENLLIRATMNRKLLSKK